MKPGKRKNKPFQTFPIIGISLVAGKEKRFEEEGVLEAEEESN